MQIDTFDYLTRGHRVRGFRINNSPQEQPPVMFCRGGTGTFGAIDEHIINVVISPIAEAGFTVYASQYSGGPESEGKDEYGGAEVTDILDLYEYVNTQYRVQASDPWMLLGYSRGAMSGCLAIAHGLPVARAAFVGGLYDQMLIDIERPDMYRNFLEKQRYDATQVSERQRRSPLYFADKLKHVPMLLLHSKDDARVPVRQALAMKAALGEAAVLKIFTHDDHSLRVHNRERNQLIIDWFKQTRI